MRNTSRAALEAAHSSKPPSGIIKPTLSVSSETREKHIWLRRRQKRKYKEEKRERKRRDRKGRYTERENGKGEEREK